MSPAAEGPLPTRGAGVAGAPAKPLLSSSSPRSKDDAPLPSGRPLRSSTSRSSSKGPSKPSPPAEEEAAPLSSETIPNGTPERSTGSGEGTEQEGEEGTEAGEEGGEAEGGEEEGEEAEEGDSEKKGGSTTPSGGAARRPGSGAEEARKSVGRFVLFFLGFMGIYMLVDNSARNSIALTLGLLLQPALGFDGHYMLFTMFLTAALEMGFSALAYHYTSDWVESATVQYHSTAIRPLWTKALRSQKKEHIAALKPHMDALQIRQSKVTIAQLKGMVITWVLLIAIYTWMGLFIFAQCPKPAISPSMVQMPGTVVQPFILNSSVAGGYAPFSYHWWMTGTSTSLASENATGPSGSGLNATFWRFTPPSTGSYLITLQVKDVRGSISWAFQGLQYGSQAAPPTVSTPPFECAGTQVLLFGAQANLLGTLGPFPLWFVTFSLYTIPLNLIFRRYLKHAALAQRLPGAKASPTDPVLPGGPGGASP